MADQKLNIIFTGDVTQLKSAVQSAVSDLTKFEQKLKDSLGAEGFAQINQAVDSLKQKLSSLQAIDIKANPEALFKAVREVSAELGKLKDSEVLLSLNDDKVIAQINNVDKLLSSLSASITIDANIKSEIDRIKTQLSGLTVKIGADATVAESAIKNIQSKLALLQDERFILSADGQQAESVINEIFNDLKTLKDAKVLINADGTPAENVIEQLQTDLQAALKGNILIDTSDLQRKIQALGAAEINIKADTSEVDASIKSIRERLIAFQTIDIKANPQQALTAINEILADISKIKSSELILKSDNTDVLADLNQIQSKLQGIKSEINISANLDTKNLEALLKPLSTQVSVDVNTKAAEAELKALLQQVRNLKGQDILINLDGTQVVKTIDAIEKELLQLQTKLKQATNPADIARLTQQLQLFKNSLSATGANQFSSNLNKAQNATFAFSQVLREAPAFAFSFQTGILALSNNLPILADRLKEARAAGASFGQIAGGIAKSLVSLPGILTIASTALIFLGDKLFNTGKQAKETAKDLATIGGTISDSTASVQGDIAKVQALAEAFRNSSGSFERQKRIIDELKDTNKSYFGDLEAGKTTYEDITKAANAYTDALVNQAIINGLSDAISDLSKEYGTLLIKYNQQTKAANESRIALQKINKEQATNVQGLTGQNREVNIAQNSFNKLQGELGSTGKALGEIGTRIKEFRAQIGVFVGQQLKLKPLDFDDANNSLKDGTENLLARMRAFVKQFGDVFVVPDLEESFTNTKDIIIKAAKQLEADIKNLNLKIKVPVQVITEADFLQPEFTVDPNFKLDENIRERILKEIQAELTPISETVDVTITPNIISKDQTKEIDELVKKFAELGNRGLEALRKIDFTDVNKGIADGKKSLERINEELAITKEFSLAVGNSFASAFDAILDNEDPIKAFFRSIISELQRLIAKLIATKIAAAFLSLAFPGIGKAATLSSQLGFGGALGGQANFGLGGVGSLRAISVNVSGSVIQRGSDGLIMFSNANRSLGRVQ